MSYTGDMAKVKRQAEEQGFRVTQTDRGHWQFYAPNRKDIIVTGGTPGGGRHWNNFMSQMKRAGFDPSPGAKTSLGDALKEAADPPQEQTGPGLTALVRDAVRSRGGAGISFGEVCQVAESRQRGGVNRNSVSAVLSNLKARGEAVDVERGRWRWVEDRPKPEAPAETPWALRCGNVSAAHDAAAETPDTLERDAMVAEAMTEAGTTPAAAAHEPEQTDDEVAEDLRKLDRLLEAMAEAEDAVRRIRVFVAKRSALRAQKVAIAKLLEQLGEV